MPATWLNPWDAPSPPSATTSRPSTRPAWLTGDGGDAGSGTRYAPRPCWRQQPSSPADRPRSTPPRGWLWCLPKNHYNVGVVGRGLTRTRCLRCSADFHRRWCADAFSALGGSCIGSVTRPGLFRRQASLEMPVRGSHRCVPLATRPTTPRRTQQLEEVSEYGLHPTRANNLGDQGSR